MSLQAAYLRPPVLVYHKRLARMQIDWEIGCISQGGADCGRGMMTNGGTAPAATCPVGSPFVLVPAQPQIGAMPVVRARGGRRIGPIRWRKSRPAAHIMPLRATCPEYEISQGDWACFTLVARVLAWTEACLGCGGVRTPSCAWSPHTCARGRAHSSVDLCAQVERHPGRLRRTSNGFAAVARMASEDTTQFASEDANSSARTCGQLRQPAVALSKEADHPRPWLHSSNFQFHLGSRTPA